MRALSPSTAGFTVIELLVVLGITGLILASVVMVKPKAAGPRLNATARAIAASLQLTRARAMATNADAVFSIDIAKGEFGTVNAMHKLPPGMRVTVTVAESERAGGAAGVRYYPDGQSSGGDIVLNFEGRTEKIAINWLTGEPRLGQ